jgi:hypothetical protein
MRIWLVAMPLLIVASATTLVPDTDPTGNDAEEQRLCRERMKAIAVVQELRKEAIDDYMANRATREETVERFRQIAQVDPIDVETCLQLCYPDASVEELFDRQVASYVSATLIHQTQKRADCKVSSNPRIFMP